MPLKMRSDRKTYLSPELKKLTPDEARLLLVGGASVEDRGAKDISEPLLCLLGPLKFCACGECRFDPRDTAIDVRV
jgi:hypothetical protein